MLTEICQYLKNWFDRGLPKWEGTFRISDGSIEGISLQDGQYFRIIGSVFNDGVHQFPASELRDEEFDGAVWSMAIPPHFLILVETIADWCWKYEKVTGPNMSPFQSESFKGYSYSKSSGYSGGSSGTAPVTWKTQFAPQLAPWRKI